MRHSVDCSFSAGTDTTGTAGTTTTTITTTAADQ
jgi:hypothetical protein